MYNYIFNDNFRKNAVNNNLYNNMVYDTNKSSLFAPAEAYNNGNLYSNLYSQYKNYKPVELKANNEREQLLLDLSRMFFTAHELNLYLDLNPDDESMLALFNDYRREANALMSQYEAKYGPLNLSSNSLDNSPFSWVSDVWPWEGRYYV